jgi:hypothetical protein
MSPSIDPEFKALIPALTADELAQLEANILESRHVDAIVVWKGIVVDGHNRLDICQRHRLDYEVREVSFDGRDEALTWIIRNQFGRRNLTPFIRAELALRLKRIVAAQALLRVKSGKKPDPTVNLRQGQTTEIIGKMAGVSASTIERVEKLKSTVTPDELVKLRSGETSINAAVIEQKKVAAGPQPQPKVKAAAGPVVVDDEGGAVPAIVQVLWARREEVAKLIAAVRTVKRTLAKAKADNDPLYAGGAVGGAPVNFSSLDARLSMIVSDLQAAYPVRVCPVCHGSACSYCCGLGIISSYYYKMIPEALR